MVNFNRPLPIPDDAIALTESEKGVIRKYMDRIEAAQRQIAIAQESLSDVGMAIAARSGGTAQSYSLSADMGALIPKRSNNAIPSSRGANPTPIRPEPDSAGATGCNDAGDAGADPAE